MSTAIAKPVRKATKTGFPLTDILAYAKAGQYIAISDVQWDEYERLLEWRDEYRKGARLTYDRGELQIMVVTNPHERLRKVLAMLVEGWLSETGGEFVPSGQLTHLRKDLKKGFEPDECYYIQNWRKVAGVRQIDFLKDPPPDLMIEVEVNRKVDSRLPIIASFKVPEVWRYDGKKVSVLILQRGKKYKASMKSVAVPDFPFDEAPRFLEMASSIENDHGTIDREFRSWIRSLKKPSPKA